MSHTPVLRLFATLGLLVLAARAMPAQEARPAPPSLRLLLQTTGQLRENPSADEPNGFRARRARANWSGKALSDLSYTLQTEFARGVSLLDMRVVWEAGHGTNVHVGLFKAPFSMEALESIAAVDFVERSRVVNAIAPARQVGLMLEHKTRAGLTLQGGGFNGNGGATFVNDNSELLWIARMAYDRQQSDRRVHLAANAFASNDEKVSLSDILPAAFAGSRTGAGGDLSLQAGAWTLRAEALWLRVDPRDPDLATRNARGDYVTVVYDLSDLHRLLVRLDQFDPGSGGNTNDLVLGYTWRPAPSFQMRMNVIQPLESERANYPTLIGMLQVRV